MSSHAPQMSVEDPALLRAAIGNDAVQKRMKEEVVQFEPMRFDVAQDSTPILDEREWEVDRLDEALSADGLPEWEKAELCEEGGFHWKNGMCTDPLQGYRDEAEACLQADQLASVDKHGFWCNSPGYDKFRPVGARTEAPGGNYCDPGWIQDNQRSLPSTYGSTCEGIAHIVESTKWVEPAAGLMLKGMSLMGGMGGLIVDAGMAMHGAAENGDYSGLIGMGAGQLVSQAAGVGLRRTGEVMGNHGGLATAEVGEYAAGFATTVVSEGEAATRD
jgi:hypothetical protein